MKKTNSVFKPIVFFSLLMFVTSYTGRAPAKDGSRPKRTGRVKCSPLTNLSGGPSIHFEQYIVSWTIDGENQYNVFEINFKSEFIPCQCLSLCSWTESVHWTHCTPWRKLVDPLSSCLLMRHLFSIRNPVLLMFSAGPVWEWYSCH